MLLVTTENKSDSVNSIDCFVLLVKVSWMHLGRERLIRSHSSARFYFELSGNSNKSMPCNSNFHKYFKLEISLN